MLSVVLIIVLIEIKLVGGQKLEYASFSLDFGKSNKIQSIHFMSKEISVVRGNETT